MLTALLNIRLKQLYRSLIDIGILRILFLLGLAAYGGFVLYMKSTEPRMSLLIGIGFILLIGFLQIQRADREFLKSHFSKYKLLLLAEYFILSIPVLVCFVIHHQWIAVIIVLVGVLLAVQLEFKTKFRSLNTTLQKLIPSDAFECKAGLRKQFFILVPVWIIGLASSFYIASVPVSIFIIGLLTLSYYEKCEPYSMIVSSELSPQKFMWHKIKRQVLLLSIALLPLAGLFLIFHTELWHIVLIEYTAFIFIHVYAVTNKYAFYYSHSKSPAAQTFLGIGTIAGLTLIFMPVVWLLTFWFYIKSIHKLDDYLNDFN